MLSDKFEPGARAGVSFIVCLYKYVLGYLHVQGRRNYGLTTNKSNDVSSWMWHTGIEIPHLGRLQMRAARTACFSGC